MTHGRSTPVPPRPRADRARAGRRATGFYLVALAVTLVLAGVVSGFASSAPDGLERVAEDEGIDTAEEHALDGFVLADYGVSGIDDERLSVGLAGVAGVVLTLVAAGLLFRVARRPGTPAGDGTAGDGTGGHGSGGHGTGLELLAQRDVDG